MVHEEDGGGPFADYGQQRGGAQNLPEDPFMDHGHLDPPPPLNNSSTANGVFVHEDGGSIRSFSMAPNRR